jgi:hypothetical protein
MPAYQKKRQVRIWFYRCGKWLRQFQKFTQTKAVMPFRKDAAAENIEKKLVSCAKYGLGLARHKKIRRFIDAKFKKIGHRQLGVVGYHSDFTPWNVLASDDQIGVMDFDRFGYRGSYDDLTLFTVALEGYKSIVGMQARNIDALKYAFLRGYDMKDTDRHIFDVYLLKNTLKALSRIDIHENSNTAPVDVFYERYRKKKQINLYLGNMDDLTG